MFLSEAISACEKSAKWEEALLLGFAVRHGWLLMEEIPNNHLGCIPKPVNNGIEYQAQLVNAGFLPSIVLVSFTYCNPAVHHGNLKMTLRKKTVTLENHHVQIPWFEKLWGM